MAREFGAVVMGDARPRARGQGGEHGDLGRDARVGGLVGHDARHEETQVAAHADDAVGLPLAEPGTIGRLVGPLADGRPTRYTDTGHAPALRPAPTAVAPRQVAGPPLSSRLAGVVDWQRCVGLFLEGVSLLCELHGAQVSEGRVEPLVVVPPHVPVQIRA